MTIEERDTARAIQTIAKEMKAQRQPQPINWEQRRYEVARDILANNLEYYIRINKGWEGIEHLGKTSAKWAVAYADALIEELQKTT